MTRPGAPTTTIARELSKFKKTKNPRFLFSAIALLVKSGRLSEVMYGFYCFLFHRPSPLSPVGRGLIVPPAKLGTTNRNQISLETYEEELRTTLKTLRKQRDQSIVAIAAQIESSGQPLYCMDHGFALAGPTENPESRIENQDVILGEYANFSARLFHLQNGKVTTHNLYQDRPTVRHIHLVHRDGDEVYVATGDTDKFLDHWRLQNGKITFADRILKKFGGFTTVCQVGKKTYFGSDFSERPNYIWCLETGQKWFFPRPAYTRYCYLMLLAEGRYIFTFHRGLSRLSAGVCYSVFDTQTETFVGVGEYTGDIFLSDYVEPS